MSKINGIYNNSNGGSFLHRLLRPYINGDELTDEYYAIVLNEPNATGLPDKPGIQGSQNNNYVSVKARAIYPVKGNNTKTPHDFIDDPCLTFNENQRKMLVGLHTEFIGVVSDQTINQNDIVRVKFSSWVVDGQKRLFIDQGELVEKASVTNNQLSLFAAGVSTLTECLDGSLKEAFLSGSPVALSDSIPVSFPDVSTFITTADFEDDGGPVIQRAKALGYEIFDEAWRMWLFGIRSGNRSANSFDDMLGVAYIDDDKKWHLHYYPGTTDPGSYWLLNPSSRFGVSILKEGQYLDSWKIGLHGGRYKALTQAKPVTWYLDNTKDEKLDLDPTKLSTAIVGLNIHASTQRVGQVSTKVGKWSAGCQVHASEAGFKQMMQLAQLQVDKIGRTTFSYTLMNQWKGVPSV